MSTPTAPARTASEIEDALHDTSHAYLVVDDGEQVGLRRADADPAAAPGEELLGLVPAVSAGTLGSADFREHHGVQHSWMAGAMAGGIASEELVSALAGAGILASYGCAGLLPERVGSGIERIRRAVGDLPFACNLIHSPSEPALEREGVELFLRHRVPVVEASAFMDLTATIVGYRAAGLRRGRDGAVVGDHRVVAKVSRPEVAEKFLRPAPAAMLDALVASGVITAEQRDLALRVPVAEDVTVEADSGGHTDRRPLTAVFPVIAALRDRVRVEAPELTPVRLGAAGGIGTPWAAAAAYALGADYVVTGSVNQACLESGASDHTRALLAQAGVADFAMAPAADMFELGVELQVLQRGTMFPQRARLLHQTYTAHGGLDELAPDLRARLEKQVFRRPVAEVWDEVETYFRRRDPSQIERAAQDPKRRMALVFRWYLGMSSRWASVGDLDRLQDFQIWSGPAIGSFNAWTAGTALAEPAGRSVVEVNRQLLHGAAVATRVGALRSAGVAVELASVTAPRGVGRAFRDAVPA